MIFIQRHSPMTSDLIKISIAEFSPVPAGRTREDGPKSGEVFRDEHLVPALQEAGKEEKIVEVSLDGVEGLGSSFLEESFGGLIRKRDYTMEQLKKLLCFAEPKDPAYPPYIRLIWEYIEEARPDAA